MHREALLPAVVLVAVVRACVSHLDEVWRNGAAIVTLELLGHMAGRALAIVIARLQQLEHVRRVRLEHSPVTCAWPRRRAEPPDRGYSILHSNSLNINPLRWARHPSPVEPK